MSFSSNAFNSAASPTLSFGTAQNFATPSTQVVPFSQTFGPANQNLQTSTSWFSPPNQSTWTGMQSQPSFQGSFLSSKPSTFGSAPLPTAQSNLFATQSSGMVSSTMNSFASPPTATNMAQSSQQQNANIKFWDLPDAAKTEILEIEKCIRNERQKCLKLETQNNLRELEETQVRIDKTFQHLQIAKNTWESLVVKVQACKNVIKNEMSSVETVYAIMESATREDISTFSRRSEEALKRVFDIFVSYLREMEETIDVYERQTETALSVLQNVSKSTGWKGQAVEDVLKQEYEYFIFVGSRLANLREKFRHLKEKFLKLLQLRNADAMNPFEMNKYDGKPSTSNEQFYNTPMKNSSAFTRQQSNNFFTTPMSSWKSPLTKDLRTSSGKMDERNISTPFTGYSRRGGDIDNSSFKTPLPQVTRSSVSSFLQL